MAKWSFVFLFPKPEAENFGESGEGVWNAYRGVIVASFREMLMGQRVNSALLLNCSLWS